MSASMSSASSRQRTATSRYNFRMPLSSDSSRASCSQRSARARNSLVSCIACLLTKQQHLRTAFVSQQCYWPLYAPMRQRPQECAACSKVERQIRGEHFASFEPVKLSVVFMARHARRVAWPDAQAPSLAIPPRAPVQRMHDGPFANEAAGLRPSTRRLRRSFFLARRPFWLCQCVSGLCFVFVGKLPPPGSDESKDGALFVVRRRLRKSVAFLGSITEFRNRTWGGAGNLVVVVNHHRAAPGLFILGRKYRYSKSSRATLYNLNGQPRIGGHGTEP